MNNIKKYILEKLHIDKSIQAKEPSQEDKDKPWWRNIKLPNPPKYKKEELKGLDLIYDFIISKIRKIFDDQWPEQIEIYFKGEPNWDLTINHITSFHNDTFEMYAHGPTSPWQVYFSQMSLDEKRSIRQRLEERTFYVYTSKHGYNNGTRYTLMEIDEYNGKKGILLR